MIHKTNQQEMSARHSHIRHTQVVGWIVTKYHRAFKNAKLISKVMKMYFELVLENVLNGYSFEFVGRGKRLGSLVLMIPKEKAPRSLCAMVRTACNQSD